MLGTVVALTAIGTAFVAGTWRLSRGEPEIATSITNYLRPTAMAAALVALGGVISALWGVWLIGNKTDVSSVLIHMLAEASAEDVLKAIENPTLEAALSRPFVSLAECFGWVLGCALFALGLCWLSQSIVSKNLPAQQAKADPEKSADHETGP